VAFLLVWLVITWLSTYGKIGLIRGTARADSGLEKVSFAQLFREGMPYFWRIFGLSLLIGFPVLMITAMLLVGVSLYFAAAFAYDGGNSAYLNRLFLTVLGGFCLFIPVKFIVDMIVRQAYTAIVLEDIPILPAISRGWHVFHKNPGTVILLAILLAVIGLVVGAMVAIPVSIIASPISIVFNIVEGQSALMLVLLGSYVAIAVPVTLVLNGILISFRDAAWTLTYLRLTRSSGPIQVELQEASL
jgi:hypothetical protein